MSDWLSVHRGSAPLIVSIPHAGTGLADLGPRLVSEWRARKDADWWLAELYDFAAGLGATIVRTGISRTVIDVNRDPSGASLYPGQATTGLCPTETFDDEPLYRPDAAPDDDEIAARRERWFAPYHAALGAEIERLRGHHRHVVLYDAHSIRSRVPRLFDGALPHLNIGTNLGASCDPALREAIAAACAQSPFSSVVDGRFRGGWITRHYGRPTEGVHAIQMEIACRAYLDEPERFDAPHWPAPYDPDRAAPLRAVLTDLLTRCIRFAEDRP